MKNIKILILALYFVLFFYSIAFSNNFIISKVINVKDGDTIEIKFNGIKKIVRLYGVDAPEHKQSFGIASKNFTTKYLNQKKVKIKVLDIDKHKRFVGIVFINGDNFNKKLLSNGLAWYYGYFCKKSFCREWKQIEKQARKEKIGLWRQKNPMNPYKYRKLKKSN